MKTNIKKLRKQHNLTQKELASAIGITPCIVGRWELEQSDPSLFNAVCLADFFNVSLDELCCRKHKKKKEE